MFLNFGFICYLILQRYGDGVVILVTFVTFDKIYYICCKIFQR